MPRRNNNARRRRQTEPTLADQPPTASSMAMDLVRRGLRSPDILDIVERRRLYRIGSSELSA